MITWLAAIEIGALALIFAIAREMIMELVKDPIDDAESLEDLDDEEYEDDYDDFEDDDDDEFFDDDDDYYDDDEDYE